METYCDPFLCDFQVYLKLQSNCLLFSNESSNIKVRETDEMFSEEAVSLVCVCVCLLMCLLFS